MRNEIPSKKERRDSIKTNGVAVVYGNDVSLMAKQLMIDTGAANRIRPQSIVVIKPNLVVSRAQWKGVNTDPAVVEALIETLKQSGVSRITVADGSGMGYSATKAFEICGYSAMAQRYGLRLVDLERDRFVKVPVRLDGPFENLEIAQTVLDCDFLINMPVMKAHTFTSITCSLKNLKGVMPRNLKTKFHSVDLSRAIAQLNSIVTSHLILVDGIQGDLSSETGYTPVRMERLIIGTNPVEVDSVVADMLGYVPRSISHLNYSAAGGLGNCDLEKISAQDLNLPVQEKYFHPQAEYTKRFQCQISAEGACCTCLGNLLFALERLKEQRLLTKEQLFFIGQNQRKVPTGKALRVAVGKCAANRYEADIEISACPPSAGVIYRKVFSALNKAAKPFGQSALPRSSIKVNRERITPDS
jgi:uncharacterized protein (DUF362 family)